MKIRRFSVLLAPLAAASFLLCAAGCQHDKAATPAATPAAAQDSNHQQGASMSTPTPPVSTPAVQTGVLFHTLKIDQIEMRYAVYLPPNYDPAKPWPLILFLHGYGECGSDGVKQCSVGLLPAVLNKPELWPFVIVLPQKPEFNPLWDKFDAQVMGALDTTINQLNIDRTRIYLTGLSQGGFGTWTLAAMHPETFAAIAPVCGFGDPAFVGPRVAKLPIWALHGLKDTAVAPEKSRALIAATKAARVTDPATSSIPEPKLSEYPDADHNSWDKAYRTEKLGQWFLQYHK